MAIVINQSLEDSRRGFEKIKDKDPFPEIPFSLLNSADIKDYAEKAFILSPFYLDDEYFKPASYSIKFNGHYLYWDYENGTPTRIEETLKEGQSFILKSNSLVFIQLEPYIQLPNYLAARFNLQIKHVYRGLLLGTGPLVDPGFHGYLNIPLHNWTNKDYKIAYGEPIIWMEFSKVSPNYWHDPSIVNERKGKFVEFKRPSQNRVLNDYIHLAEPNTPILSSLNEQNHKLVVSLDKTENINKRTESLLKWFSLSIVFGIAGIISSVAGFMWYTFNIDKKIRDYIQYPKTVVTSEDKKFLEDGQKFPNLNQLTDSLIKVQELQQKEIEMLRNKIKDLSKIK